mmetsp:Transcript_18712/g.46482  ORF Transcript_18712/g.46482 Transcript_18712/m.46482 type:complete len:374 (-) Transcript_18712:63-1184(-)
MSIGGRLAEDGASEVQIANNGTGSEIKVLFDNLGQIGIGRSLLGGSVRVHKDRQRVVDSNRIRQLHQCPLAQSSGNQRLGDPAGGIGRGPINLGGVLARKGATPVGAPSTVGVNDDFSSRQTGVPVRSSNDESSGRIQMVDGLFVQILFGNDLLDHVFHKIARDLFLGHVLRVLAGNDNRVDALGDGSTLLVELVLAGDLRFGIGTNPVAGSVLADLGNLGSELGGQHVRQRHEGFRLVGSVTKHDSLVTGTEVFHLLGIDGLGNVRGLFLDGHNDVAGLVVKSLSGVVVSNVLDGIADDLLVVDGGRGGDLSKNHDHSRLTAGLAGDAGFFVSGQAGVQDGIRNLIGKLVRVSLVDRFRSEKKGRHGGLNVG